MTIRVNLDLMLVKRSVKLSELAEAIDIALPNLSILKTNKARAIRFSTLDSICRALDCQPGDLLEYIPDDDLVTLMQGSKIFLFPSFYEGFGLPILEAMQCGVPVLASRVTSIPELGVDAIHYADPSDTVDIADGITQLLENEDYRSHLKSKGFEQVKNFSWGKTAGIILETIKTES